MARIQIQALQRDKKKDRRIMLIGVGLGLVALVLNLVWMRQVARDRINLLRAKETVQAGTIITRDLFEVQTISGDLAAMKKTFIDEADLANYLGQQLGETVLLGHLLTLRSILGGGSQPPPGKTLLPVETREEVVTGSHSVRPHDFVDIWGWINGEQRLLRGCAQVHAVGNQQNVSPSGDGRELRYPTVTIILDPDEVKPLLTNLKLVDGNIRFAIVNPCAPNQQTKALGPLNIAPEAPPAPVATPEPRQKRRKK